MPLFAIVSVDSVRGIAFAARAGDGAHYLLHAVDFDASIEQLTRGDWIEGEIAQTKKGGRLLRARLAGPR